MRALFLLGLGLCIASMAHAADVPGAHDHPDVKRFAGSEIVGYAQRGFDAYDLQTSPYASYNFNTRGRTYVEPALHLEGAITTLWYEAPGDTTALELARNYRNDLEGSGFQVLYDTARDPTFARASGFLNPFGYVEIKGTRKNNVFYNADAKRVQALTAKRERADGSAVYVSVITVDWAKDGVSFGARRGAYAAVDVVEPKAMKQNMVRLSAEEMSSAIASTGRATLYGILFDTNKAELKPASRPALEEIARLLKSQPALRLHIVGHTDHVGNLDANLALSRQRAEAVQAALRSDYGVAAQRLTANGVAYLAPVASNANEDGRAKNRRVELVPQ